MSLSYESSGVRYDQLDAFKRACQQAARGTANELAAHGYAEPATTRGESAYLIEGMKFSMTGWWEIKLAIDGPAGADQVTFNTVVAEPGAGR